jgi:hypothetical protein
LGRDRGGGVSADLDALREARGRRERRARVVGVAVGLAVAAVGMWAIRWPVPAISAACGYGAYLLVRGRRR